MRERFLHIFSCDRSNSSHNEVFWKNVMRKCFFKAINSRGTCKNDFFNIFKRWFIGEVKCYLCLIKYGIKKCTALIFKEFFYERSRPRRASIKKAFIC